MSDGRNTTTRDRDRRTIARTKPPCGICGEPIDHRSEATLPTLQPEIRRTRRPVMAADETWENDLGLDADIDDPAPFTYPTREELWEQLHHAVATARRLHDTVYYERAHRFIDDILWDLEEIRGR